MLMRDAARLSLGFVLLTAGLCGAADVGHAQTGLQLWNTTTVTITSFQFAAPGTTNWGFNQCENDSDKSVSADERLRLTGIKPGRYDVRLADSTGRVCTVRDVEVKAGGKYALKIGNNDLKDCAK